MRADKDFKTYEQALTIVQRYGDLAEAEYKKGKHAEAHYNLAHATFVGVKHLLFMAADAAIDRAEARELAAQNHLAIVELLSLALAGLENGEDQDGGAGPAPAAVAKSNRVRKASAGPGRKAPTRRGRDTLAQPPKTRLRRRRP